MKKSFRGILNNQLGAFSIEMLLVIGVIVILVVVSMSAFSRETSEVSNKYDQNVNTAIQQQSILNSQLIQQQRPL